MKAKDESSSWVFFFHEWVVFPPLQTSGNLRRGGFREVPESVGVSVTASYNQRGAR